MYRPGLNFVEIVLIISSLGLMSATFYPQFSSYRIEVQPAGQNQLIANLQSGVTLAQKAHKNDWLETLLPDEN